MQLPVCSQEGALVYSEIWAMYARKTGKGTLQLVIITCWRYPGKSPARDPIPADIKREVAHILSAG